MATTAAPNRPRRRSAAGQPRVSVPGRGISATEQGEHDQYDLLTAALIGATIGAGLTFMMRRGPSGRRPVSPVLQGIGEGAKWAAKRAGKAGRRGAHWAAHQSEELWDRVPRDEIREHVSDYMGRAREAIDDVVESELSDLRRAIRRQRKRLGV